MTVTGHFSAERRDVPERDVSVAAFTGPRSGYYMPAFERIERGRLPYWHMHFWGLLIPWFWAAYRGVWLMFWISLAIDVFAVVCLMQVIKYTPLLAEAQAAAADNATLIERYSRWIRAFGSVGAVSLVLGRLWMGSFANRWYYGRYARWRIHPEVARGVDLRRVLVAVAILLIVAPLTIYRATEQRLDPRACLNQIRAIETVNGLLEAHAVAEAADLLPLLAQQRYWAAAEMEALDTASSLTDSQRSRRSALRSEIRQIDRDVEVIGAYSTTTAKNRFDCWFIDDFPTLARLDPPPEAVYRRIPDPDAIAAGDADATKVLREVKDPIEGRRVTVFTYSAETIDISINFLRATYAGIFDAMTNVLRQALIRVEIAFMLTPWFVVAFLFIALAWAYTGVGTTVFVSLSLGFLALFELWQVAMQTMALVVVSTALCVIVGLPVGVWMAKNKWARWITEPILDVMQTIPSLSYLVPAVAFFGISQPPAVLATVVFAMPPMIKLTALGIRQVPESTKEAAMAFGASERQLLRKVELPMAVPSIMAGLNQTIMLALSMATISAFIGAEGLGAIVTASLGDAQAGKGLLAGIAIALVAMMIDRILRGIRSSFSRI